MAQNADTGSVVAFAEENAKSMEPVSSEEYQHHADAFLAFLVMSFMA